LPPVVGGKRKHSNRYAISIAVAREEFEKQPLARKGATEYPTFIEAVVLAASVSLRYTHHIPIPTEHKKCLKKVVKKHMDLFETEYSTTLLD
jgi:hypothetical protein